MARKKKTKDDAQFEIDFYEGVLKQNGDFLQALVALGDLYTKEGHYQKGLEVDKKLSKLRPDDPVILYNLACSYSLLEKVDEAFAVMKMAIESGYDELEFLQQDSDLENLLKDSRFQRYLSQLKTEKHKKNDS